MMLETFFLVEGLAVWRMSRDQLWFLLFLCCCDVRKYVCLSFFNFFRPLTGPVKNLSHWSELWRGPYPAIVWWKQNIGATIHLNSVSLIRTVKRSITCNCLMKKKILVILSTSVERFVVSCMQDLFYNSYPTTLYLLDLIQSSPIFY